MRYLPYAQKHATGSNWISSIPINWSLHRLRHLLCGRLEYGANESAELDDHDLPRYIRITDIDENDSLRDETFRSLPEEVARPYLLEDGDVLFARSGATSGKTFLYRSSWGRCAYAGYLIRARLRRKIVLPEFLRYFTASSTYWQWLSSSYIQSTIQNVSAEKYADLTLPIPPLEEQRIIVCFLDAKIAKIDELVANKRQLIEKLKEKRSALIARTVTQGLPPEAALVAGLHPHPKMKDSGVEWLGQIPEYWGIEKFSREVQITEGQVDPEVEPYLSMPLIAPNHIESGTGRLITIETAADQYAESGKYLCKEGYVIYSKIRPALQKAVIAPSDCLCSADMYPMDCRQKIANHYLLWLLLSSPFTGWSVLEADRVAMPKINRETLSQLRLPVPPLAEQHAIVDFLEAETLQLDSFVGKVESALLRLQEYRQALITAAVTGKIDVRAAV